MIKKALLYIFFLLLVSLAVLLIWGFFREEQFHYGYDKTFQFDPLELNDNLEFILIDGSDSNSPEAVTQESSLNWSEEYFKLLTRKFFEFELGNDVSTWQLNSISYLTNCEKIETGFESSSQTYFKIVNENGKKIRIRRNIYINLEKKTITVIEGYFHPVAVKWRTIDFSKIVYSADDILRLTEENGGRDLREEIKNDCEISISYSPNPGEIPRWNISYNGRRSENAKIDELLRNGYDPISGKTLP